MTGTTTAGAVHTLDRIELRGAVMSTFQTPEPITLSVELSSGEVNVLAVTTDVTEIDLVPLEGSDRDAESVISRARIEQVGDTITVHVPDGKSLGFLRRTPELSLTVRMPAGSNLEARLRSADLKADGELGGAKVEVASGDVWLGDLAGDVTTTSASGDIRVGTVGGNVRLNSGSGDLTIERACGDCTTQTASGDIQIDAAEGGLTARTASGDVTIREAGTSSTIKTASGDVTIGQVGTGTVEANTASGDITVGVQRGVLVWTDVSSLTGVVSSDFESTEPSEVAAGGTLELRAHSTTGDVTLRSA
jgi:DUF4097 and DUF4098 domain-containing protein YvlB